LTDAVNAALQRYDALMALSALSTAPRFDQPTDALSAASPIQTIPFNVTGHPAISVPTGLGANGLPIGVQIAGRPFDEPKVFRIGRAVEKLSGWEATRFPFSAS
jgi:aspartyl-tRNA(Asn)/glutamyl-tRNA(Gln) amidotransferase subunit A